MNIQILGTAIVVLISLLGQTQATIDNKPKDPEYVNQFLAIDKGGNLVPLERGTARTSSKVHGLGGAEVVYAVPNDHSPVRLLGNDVRFVVRLENHDVDPASVVQFYSVKVAKNQRELPAAKAHMFGGAKNKMQDNVIAFDVKKYSDASVMIVPRQTLPSGEYLLTVHPEWNNGTVYCFGIQ